MGNMTRKEMLKEPDEFITTTSSVLKWIRENPKRFISAVIILVLIGGGGFGFHFWRVNREQTAMSAYVKAGADVKLNAEITRKYTDTRAGKLAKLRLAGLAYAKGDNAEAVRDANEFIDSWGSEDMLFYESMLIMAMGYVGQKETGKALDILDKCIKGGPDAIRDQALFYKAQTLVSMGKRPEAVTTLQTLLAKKAASAALPGDVRDETAPGSSRYQELARSVLADLTLATGAPLDAK